MVVTLGLVTISLVPKVLTVVNAIANLHIAIAANGATVALPVATFVLAGCLIRIVAVEKKRKM